MEAPAREIQHVLGKDGVRRGLDETAPCGVLLGNRALMAVPDDEGRLDGRRVPADLLPVGANGGGVDKVEDVERLPALCRSCRVECIHVCSFVQGVLSTVQDMRLHESFLSHVSQ